MHKFVSNAVLGLTRYSSYVIIVVTSTVTSYYANTGNALPVTGI